MAVNAYARARVRSLLRTFVRQTQVRAAAILDDDGRVLGQAGEPARLHVPPVWPPSDDLYAIYPDSWDEEGFFYWRMPSGHFLLLIVPGNADYRYEPSMTRVATLADRLSRWLPAEPPDPIPPLAAVMGRPRPAQRTKADSTSPKAGLHLVRGR